MELSSIFEPNSIAVIGASSNETKWGGRIFKNLLNDFKGKVYPVNPKESKVQGITSYPSILDIPDNIEMSVIAIPSKLVINAVKECAIKGVKGLVVISSGFGEIGNNELENELVSIVKKNNMCMIGPNTLGIVNQSKGLNASVIAKIPSSGSISFITQSGTLGLALADWTIQTGLGLSKIISTGNKANIDDIDLIKYLNEDPLTDVIAMYVEGIKRGKEFIEVAKRIKKPIIVIKTGRSKRGAKAVFSHTGSVAGSDEIFSAAFRQAGVLRVDTIDEIFDSALALSCQPLPKGNNVAIISNGGGASIVATDACEKYGLNVVELLPETKAKIKSVIPEFASSSNPIDTAGVYAFEVYNEVIKALLEDKNVDSVIVIYVHTVMSMSSIPPAEAVIELKVRTQKPIIACWMGGEGKKDGVEILESGCLPNYSIPERAVKALSSLVKHKEFIETVKIDKGEKL